MERTYGEKAVLLAEEVVKKDGGMENSRAKKEGLPLFVRDDLPSYSGIATFLKSPYIENPNDIKDLDVVFLGAPFDVGTTFRPGTRFGPESMRSISKLFKTYNFEQGIDLAQEIKMGDLGDIYSIHNIDRYIDQLAGAVSTVLKQGVFPVILGGDHSIAYGTIKGVAESIDGNVGVIQLDRHLDTTPYMMGEKMHDTPLYHAGQLKNVNPENIVHIGIGGWQNDPRAAVGTKERGETVLTCDDVEELGVDKVAEIALEKAWANGVKAVYLTVDIDVVDSGFISGTGWPEPGGLTSREVLRLVRRLAEPGLVGMELVEVSPPYDNNQQTALLGVRIICDTICSLVKNKHLPLY
ncbi:agmatinase family protein [Tissierella carlieri]|uniref:Agmatinase family protein n=1 Tax=Tissierella carlieri TaxID=689904 RepID=A0ABT1S701_9FIRM|nr:agmatinase family protein [Tissierella carlieri]MCQ4922249.1 agmatinase family protein [Tissierella carlieri]